MYKSLKDNFKYKLSKSLNINSQNQLVSNDLEQNMFYKTSRLETYQQLVLRIISPL